MMTLAVRAKYTLSGCSKSPTVLTAKLPVKGAAAKANPVPIKPTNAECLEPALWIFLPGFLLIAIETIKPTTAAKI